MTLHTVLYNYPVPSDAIALNVTSWSKEWTRCLSPYFLGPVEVAPGIWAKSIENGFQYSKLYPDFAKNDEPLPEWWFWAQAGWRNPRPIHHPFGKKRADLGYVVVEDHGSNFFKWKIISHDEARNIFFVRWYADLVQKTPEYQALKELYQHAEQDIYLVDFEGYLYDREHLKMADILASPVPFGQGMVLSWLLIGELS